MCEYINASPEPLIQSDLNEYRAVRAPGSCPSPSHLTSFPPAPRSADAGGLTLLLFVTSPPSSPESWLLSRSPPALNCYPHASHFFCPCPGHHLRPLDSPGPSIVLNWRVAVGFLAGSVVKNLPANAGYSGSIPGSGRFPWRRKWQPTPVFLPGKSHGQRSLAGYSLWSCKELETT